ncbi:MAG: hypothetical protein ACTS2F_23535 [Thainema sp.]
MSDRNGNFLGGFLLGTLVGGVVGGVAGVLAASRLASEEDESISKKRERRKRQSEMTFSTEEEMEAARRGLEDKIAQLNEAIDDVRFQLNSVNGRPLSETQESSISHD